MEFTMKKINSKKVTKKIAKILSSENLIDNSQKRCFKDHNKKCCNSCCKKCNCDECNNCNECGNCNNYDECNSCDCCNNCCKCNNCNCCNNCDECNNCNSCDTCKCCSECESNSICDIIESIALVETAISHILNAEGEKIQKAVQISDNVCELLEVNNSVRNTIRDITELECMLSRKLEIAISKMEGGNYNGCSIG